MAKQQERRRSRIQIVSATLALMMIAVIVLSGCSKNNNAAPETSGAQQSETKQPAETNSEQPEGQTGQTSEGPPGKYDPPIDLSIVTFAWGAPKFAEGEDENNNRWFNYIKDNLGIKLTSLWEAPTDQMEQKVNLMIASGNIPDIMAVTPMQLVQLQKAGMIEDLTDAYEKYAPQAVKDVINGSGPEVLDAARINGRLWGLPYTGAAKESAPVLWIREDWMKKLNLPEPKTMDDLLMIAEAFTTKDPDGNNKNDTYGLPLDKDLTNVNGFFNAYHAYKGIWIKDDNGKLVYSGIQPEMRTALAKLQELHKAGQIDKEFGVKDVAKVDESIGRNMFGIYLGTMTGGYAMANITPGVRWIPYPMPSIDDKPVLFQHPLSITYGFYVVKKGVKNPEALFSIADVWLKLFYENKDDAVYNEYNTDGVKYAFWTAAPVILSKPFKNMEISLHLEPLLQSDAQATDEQLSQLTPEERQVYSRIMEYKNGKDEYWYFNSRSGIGGAGGIVSKYVENNQYMPEQFNGTMTPAMVQKMPILNKMEVEMMTKIIMGAPLTKFDEYIEEWNKLGGEQITKEVNEWLASK